MNKQADGIRYYFEEHNFKIRILCFGELGKLFSDSFAKKLGEGFILQFVEDSDELKQVITSDSKDEMLMLITEYEPDIWKKHLDNEEIRIILEEVELTFIVIHPKNSIIPLDEHRLIQLMGGKENVNKLILAMPVMNRKKSLETMCWAIYDMLAAISRPGYVTIDYTDLIIPGQYDNWYGIVYEGECRNCRQLRQTAREICAQVMKEVQPEDILSALMIITTDRNETLMDINNVALAFEKLFSDDTSLTWGHIQTDTECAITLVLYCEMEEYDDCLNIIHRYSLQ